MTNEEIEYDPCKTCGYTEGSPFCLQYCPYDIERKKEQEPTEKPMTVDEMEREYEKSKALFHKIVECDDAISRQNIIDIYKSCADMLSDEELKGADLVMEWVNNAPPVTQKPIECDDAISRNAALEKMADYVASGYADSAEDFEEYSRIICQLPSVTQKSGKWIWDSKSNVYRCSCCNQFPWRIDTEENDEVFINMERTNAYKFCPHCGTRMVESQESEG